jgi:hypothetical protein
LNELSCLLIVGIREVIRHKIQNNTSLTVKLYDGPLELLVELLIGNAIKPLYAFMCRRCINPASRPALLPAALGHPGDTNWWTPAFPSFWYTGQPLLRMRS